MERDSREGGSEKQKFSKEDKVLIASFAIGTILGESGNLTLGGLFIGISIAILAKKAYFKFGVSGRK